jgi:hypothetical protein
MKISCKKKKKNLLGWKTSAEKKDGTMKSKEYVV